MFRKIVQIAFLILSVLGLVTVNYTLFVLFLVTSLLLGPFFCGWLCPFGLAQDLLSKIAKVLKLPKLIIPSKIERFLKFTRYILFTFVFLGFSFALLLDSPYRVFSGVLSWNFMFISIGSWILFGAVIVMGLFVERPFCRYLCSEGARYGAVSILRAFSIKRDASICIDCKKCDKSCPMQIDVSTVKFIRDPQCNNCFECINACPVDGCLTYNFILKKNNKENS